MRSRSPPFSRHALCVAVLPLNETVAMAESAAALLVAGKVVTADGDDPLLLAHYLTTGGVILGKKRRGIALSASHAKRLAANALDVAPAEVPALVDGSDGLVVGIAFPDRGFTRGSVREKSPLVLAIADAYALTSRAHAAQVLRGKLEDITKGFEACDSECLQLVQSSGDSTASGLQRGLAGIVGGDCRVRVRQDSAGRSRVMFNIGDGVIRAEYVSVVSGPAHRARQVAELLEASEDLRLQWDVAAEGVGPSVVLREDAYCLSLRSG